MHLHSRNNEDRGREDVRERIRAARASAQELLEQRREEVRRDLEERTKELSGDQDRPSAA